MAGQEEPAAEARGGAGQPAVAQASAAEPEGTTIRVVELEAWTSVHEMIAAAILSCNENASLREIYRACELNGRIAYKRAGGSRYITQNEHWKSQIRHALYTSERFVRAAEGKDAWNLAKAYARQAPQTVKVLVRAGEGGVPVDMVSPKAAPEGQAGAPGGRASSSQGGRAGSAKPKGRAASQRAKRAQREEAAAEEEAEPDAELGEEDAEYGDGAGPSRPPPARSKRARPAQPRSAGQSTPRTTLTAPKASGPGGSRARGPRADRRPPSAQRAQPAWQGGEERDLRPQRGWRESPQGDDDGLAGASDSVATGPPLGMPLGGNPLRRTVSYHHESLLGDGDLAAASLTEEGDESSHTDLHAVQAMPRGSSAARKMLLREAEEDFDRRHSLGGFGEREVPHLGSAPPARGSPSPYGSWKGRGRLRSYSTMRATASEPPASQPVQRASGLGPRASQSPRGPQRQLFTLPPPSRASRRQARQPHEGEGAGYGFEGDLLHTGPLAEPDYSREEVEYAEEEPAPSDQGYMLRSRNCPHKSPPGFGMHPDPEEARAAQLAATRAGGPIKSRLKAAAKAAAAEAARRSSDEDALGDDAVTYGVDSVYGPQAGSAGHPDFRASLESRPRTVGEHGFAPAGGRAGSKRDAGGSVKSGLSFSGGGSYGAQLPAGVGEKRYKLGSGTPLRLIDQVNSGREPSKGSGRSSGTPFPQTPSLSIPPGAPPYHSYSASPTPPTPRPALTSPFSGRAPQAAGPRAVAQRRINFSERGGARGRSPPPHRYPQGRFEPAGDDDEGPGEEEAGGEAEEEAEARLPPRMLRSQGPAGVARTRGRGPQGDEAGPPGGAAFHRPTPSQRGRGRPKPQNEYTGPLC